MHSPSDSHDAACHCGTVRFRVTLDGGLAAARRCSCSFCRMRGAVAVSAKLADIRFLAGEENLTLYTFNTGTARHYFCKTCGIYTHHQRRSNPQQYGVNLACLAGLNPFDLPAVPVLDGEAHPADHGGAVRRIGTLRFEPAG